MKRIMMIAVMVGMMAGCSESPALKSDALAYMEASVIPELLSPSTTVLARNSISVRTLYSLSDAEGVIRRQEVHGHLDTQNVYGAMVRRQWSVIFADTGYGFKLVQAEIDGKVVQIADHKYADRARKIRDAEIQASLAKSEAEFRALMAKEEEDRKRRVAAEQQKQKEESEKQQVLELARQKRLADAEEKRKAIALKEWEDRVALEIATMRGRILTIDGDIAKHEEALTKLPANPAGGAAYAEVEKHRKEIASLNFQKQLIQERLAEVDREAKR